MTNQPEALRLADELLFAGRFAHESEDVAAKRRINRNSEAATELRRLHEEVKCEERRFNDLWDQFAALDKVNQELLEALKLAYRYALDHADQEYPFDWAIYCENLYQAIAKAEVKHD